MQLAVSSPLLLSELKSAQAVLHKWIVSLEEEGIPGVTTPQQTTLAANTEEWVSVFAGEMQIVAAKCDALATAIAQEVG